MPNHVTDVPRRPLAVLLVEDDPGDVMIAQEALKAGRLHSQLTVVPDGAEALAYLRQQNAYGAAQRPDLILLDLNLPGMSGHEVLAAVKSDPALRAIPVVILTTSGAREDVVRSYDQHANVFVTKPVDFDHFTEIVKQIDDFFMTVAQLPPTEGRASALLNPTPIAGADQAPANFANARVRRQNAGGMVLP